MHQPDVAKDLPGQQMQQGINNDPGYAISNLNSLQIQFKTLLDGENLESIDEVAELITENLQLQRDPATQFVARQRILLYQDLLSRYIEIKNLMIKQIAVELDLDEDITLDNIKNLVKEKSQMLTCIKIQGSISEKNKIEAEIDQCQEIIETMRAIKKYEKAKNGTQDPIDDFRAQYSSLTLEKRLQFLSQYLQQENFHDYSELLINDQVIDKSKEFEDVLKPFRNLINQEKWDRVSTLMFKTFLRGDQYRHYAMKIYFMSDQKFVISPILMIKAYEAIKEQDVPEDCDFLYQGLVGSFITATVDNLNQQVAELAKENIEFGAIIMQIMMTLRPSLPNAQEQIIKPKSLSPHYIDEFEESFQHSQTFIKAKEALYKKEIITSSQLLRSLLGEIASNLQKQEKFCQMYQIIIKEQPDIRIVLSEDQVFSSFAPIQLKNSVIELFLELKNTMELGVQNIQEQEEIKQEFMSMDRLDAYNSRSISEKIKEIFYEDPSFYKMIHWYLIELSDYGQIVRPCVKIFKSLKDLHQEHLAKALSQIMKNQTRPSYKIDDFMAVDIDIDIQALKAQIVKCYQKDKKLNWQSLTIVFYDLIKKKRNFENFITHLSHHDLSSNKDMLFTQQFFLSQLLENSDTYLRTMIFMACSFFMPLPLVSYRPVLQKHLPKTKIYHVGMNSRDIQKQSSEDSQLHSLTSQTKIEFLPNVYEELFYCFEKHMSVLAFKVSANPNKSPHGCTSITNFVFNRTFSTHSNSFVNYGSIEIQFDLNFQKPIFVPVADAHGLVEEEILEQAYPIFNIFMIHSFLGPEHQVKVEDQIKKIRHAVRNPLIFKIIHVEGKIQNDFTVQNDGKNSLKISISRFSDMLEIPKQKFRETILQEFFKFIGDHEAYESNFLARLDSKKQFYQFASIFRQQSCQIMQFEETKFDNYEKDYHDKSQLLDGLEIIQNFLILINKNKEQLRSKQVLTMNFLYEEACILENQMIRDSTLNSSNCEIKKSRIDQLYEDMKNLRPSRLTEEVKKIIYHKNYLGLTYIISKLIRSFLNYHFKPNQEEREQLRTQSQSRTIQHHQKEKILNQINEITMKLEKNWYSNEFVFREFYIFELSK